MRSLHQTHASVHAPLQHFGEESIVHAYFLELCQALQQTIPTNLLTWNIGRCVLQSPWLQARSPALARHAAD